MSIIYILYFIHSLQDDLPKIFIEPIRFTEESISKHITFQHCCELGFCVKYLAKWATKESEFWSFMTFWSTPWKCCSILFWKCFCYFQLKSHHSIYMWLCKNTASTIFTSVFSHTVYSGSQVAVALSINKIFRC